MHPQSFDPPVGPSAKKGDSNAGFVVSLNMLS
jgi:hypothetical protein